MNHLRRSIYVCMLTTILLTLQATEVARAAQLTCGTWSIVSSPNAGTSSNFLQAMAAVSTNDVWAVGFYFAMPGSNVLAQTLTEHWNGTSWSIVSSPNVGSSNNDLNGVTTIPANNQVWTAGIYDTNPTPQTLTEFYC